MKFSITPAPRWLAPLVMLLLASWSLAWAQPSSGLPARLVAPTDQAQFRRLVLDNGLRVLLVSDPRFNRSAASIVANVGQIDDPRNLPGMAHFVEHVVSRGNARYPGENEFIEYIARNGGSRNAYTSSDHTNYHFEVRHEALEGALDRLAHCFISPAFKADLLQREVSAVHNESMRYIQSDGRRIISVMREVYDPTSGESLFSAGNRSTLAGADSAAVRAFFEAHYSAHRMALAIAGRARLDELERWAREKFTAIPRREVRTAERVPTFLPRRDALRLVKVEPLQELRQLRMEFVLPATRPMFASRADRLLEQLLEHPGPGGLVDTLKREGLANQVSVSKWDRTEAYGSLILAADLTQRGEREMGRVMETVFAWIEFLRRAPFPRDFHEGLARVAALEETYGNRGEGSALAVRLANQALFYPLEVAERAGTAWGAPSEPDYRRLLDALVPERMIALLAAKGVPTDRRERYFDVAYSIHETDGPAYAALKRPAAAAGFTLPGANPFVPGSTELLSERAISLIDEPALALRYAPDTEFLRPQTALLARFVPVRAMSGASQQALMALWMRALQDTLEPDLAEAANAGVRVSPEATQEGWRLVVSGYGDSPGRVMRRIAERMRAPELGATRFADLQERAVRSLVSYPQSEAFVIAGDRLQAMQREVRHLPEQLLAATRAATWPEVQRFGRQMLAQGRIEMLVHGHMTPEDATAAARAFAAALGTRAAPEAELLRRRQLVMAAGETIVDRGLVEGSNAVWRSEHLLGDASARTRALASLLGAFVSGPFFGEMRTRQQLGYIASAGAQASFDERSLLFVIQSSTHGSEELRQRAEAFIANLPAELRALGDAEWAALKAGARSRLEEKPTSIGARAERLFATAYDFRGDWDRTRSTLAALDAVTREDAATMLADALSPASARRRVVMLDPKSRPPATPGAVTFTDLEAWKRGRQYR